MKKKTPVYNGVFSCYNVRKKEGINMQEMLKNEFAKRIQHCGYFIVSSDDENVRLNFINDVCNLFPQVEVISDYGLKSSRFDIGEKLKNHTVMLIDLETKLEEDRLIFDEDWVARYGEHVSKKMGIYLSLIRYREYAKDYPLILVCNLETAKMIMGNDANLSSFARNYISLDNEIYKELKGIGDDSVKFNK